MGEELHNNNFEAQQYPISEEGILVPDNLKENILTETRSELVSVFVDTLTIQHNLENFTSELTKLLNGYLRQEINFLSVIDSRYLRGVILEVLMILQVSDTETFYELYFKSENQYVVIGDIAINFSNILGTNFELSSEEYIEAYNLGIIDRSIAWEFLEGNTGFLPERNGGFTLSRAIDTFGLDRSIENSLGYIFEPPLNSQEHANLILMVQAILSVESSGGWNISHNTGASSADGYFQYLTQNGRRVEELRDPTAGDSALWYPAGGEFICPEGIDCQVRTRWHTNSYETALSSLNQNIVERFPVFETEKAKIEHDIDGQIVSRLNANEQIVLFLSDITRNGRNEIVRDFLENPSRENFIKIYKLHHTDLSDEDTQRVLNERLKGYFE